MRSRKRWSSVLGAAAVVTALAVVAAGCGSSKKSSSSSTSSSGSGKTFATLKVVYGDTDYMDPGLSYRVESWQLFQNVYEGLLVQKHGEGAEGAKVVEYLNSLRALRLAIRHDACDGKDLKSARAATRRDMKKHAALTDEMLAYAHKAMAEAYRKKTQSGKNSK